MKLIDSNIVIYSLGRVHEYREASRWVMLACAEGSIAGVVSTETLQEVVHYYHSRQMADVAISTFDDLGSSLPEPIAIDFRTALLARDILARHSTIETRDAFHAATVFQHNLEGIISADRGFDIIEGLRRFDPKELAA